LFLWISFHQGCLFFEQFLYGFPINPAFLPLSTRFRRIQGVLSLYVCAKRANPPANQASDAYQIVNGRNRSELYARPVAARIGSRRTVPYYPIAGQAQWGIASRTCRAQSYISLTAGGYYLFASSWWCLV